MDSCLPRLNDHSKPFGFFHGPTLYTYRLRYPAASKTVKAPKIQTPLTSFGFVAGDGCCRV